VQRAAVPRGTLTLLAFRVQWSGLLELEWSTTWLPRALLWAPLAPCTPRKSGAGEVLVVVDDMLEPSSRAQLVQGNPIDLSGSSCSLAHGSASLRSARSLVEVASDFLRHRLFAVAMLVAALILAVAVAKHTGTKPIPYCQR